MEHFYKNVPGNFTFPNFYTWLVNQLPKNQPSKGVEVGVMCGQSAAYLSVEIINNNVQCTLDLVDILAKESYLNNLKPVQHIIGKCYEHINSWDVAINYVDESLDFVFLDGDHSYDSIKKDICAWLPKVKKNGIIAGHDFSNQYPGIIQAVMETFDYWEIWRGTHWDDAVKFAPEQKDWYWPVWSVKV